MGPKSPLPPDHTAIGQVVGAHGIKGGIKVESMTDFPTRFERGQAVWIRGREFRIQRATWHRSQVRLELEGLVDRNEAEGLQWEWVTVPADLRPPTEPDQYLTDELIGMEVVSTEGQVIGRLDDVLHSPAHDLLVIGEALIPAVDEFVTDIDLEARRITVHLIPGLLPEVEETE